MPSDPLKLSMHLGAPPPAWLVQSCRSTAHVPKPSGIRWNSEFSRARELPSRPSRPGRHAARLIRTGGPAGASHCTYACAAGLQPHSRSVPDCQCPVGRGMSSHGGANGIARAYLFLVSAAGQGMTFPLSPQREAEKAKFVSLCVIL